MERITDPSDHKIAVKQDDPILVEYGERLAFFEFAHAGCKAESYSIGALPWAPVPT